MYTIRNREKRGTSTNQKREHKGRPDLFLPCFITRKGIAVGLFMADARIGQAEEETQQVFFLFLI